MDACATSPSTSIPEVFEAGEFIVPITARGIVTRRLERMFYGPAEFEITDPDGYV